MGSGGTAAAWGGKTGRWKNGGNGSKWTVGEIVESGG